MSAPIVLTVNGGRRVAAVHPAKRLAAVLRDDFGLTGTKIGCDAGDCGACTVLLDGRQVCACMVPVAQAAGSSIETVEGLTSAGHLSTLQEAFHRHGAAQCGICTPGMLMAATALLRAAPRPDEAAVTDAIGGVLCRCTGYRKIVEAVLDAAGNGPPAASEAMPLAGRAVGTRLPRWDGLGKLDGSEIYGADRAPPEALWLRTIRSPHAHARFVFGDLEGFAAARPGLERVLTAADVPGANRFGIYPTLRDQQVFAEGYARYRGDAVCALLGTRAAVEAVGPEDLPIEWTPLAPLAGIDAAQAAGAARLHDASPGNVLVRGRVACGAVDSVLAEAPLVVEGTFETGFVEHAYIEPEAGWARRIAGEGSGDRVEVTVTTQTPYMDRDEVAHVLGIAPERVRIRPTACGGGFGGKLDQSVQPMLAVAAWLTGRRPVRAVWSRPESMMATTKRHPARMRARLGVDSDGRIVGYDFHGDFDTGAYASWGPTVAGRVPVHATGPYRVPAVLASSAAVYTNNPPAGAFRGFGVPQAAICHEALLDEAAGRLGLDRLEIRLLNALRPGDRTATGQALGRGAGLVPCLEALRPHWWALGEEAAGFNRGNGGPLRRGIGIGCMWYGIGNTAMTNPSAMRLGLDRMGHLTLYNGAVDIGQGSYTVMAQLAADALGVPVVQVGQVVGDTDLTLDAGKTSASRQTMVSGQAAMRAGLDLRAQLLRLANAGDDARLAIGDGAVEVIDGGIAHRIDLAALPGPEQGDVLMGEGRFDPPTTPLDADGQGEPYAAYAYAAQIALVEVDLELGTTRVLRMVAAHDVGRAVNPTLVEGQIHGGIAQGLGLALMEEYVPGRTENLHDYLIPTAGDMPDIECLLIETDEPVGPFGAKGIGEPALVPTAPAILGAIRDATGVTVRRVPVLPHRLRAAIRERRAG